MILNRKQWAVGQGGFHSAEYASEQDGPRIHYIYDCGSHDTESLSAEVEAYLAGLGSGNRIHALVLSHIDTDHVNGVPRLLSTQGLEVGYVLLPLLTPIERLFAISKTSAGTEASVLHLLADPRATIEELSPRTNVIEVKSGPPESTAMLDAPDLDTNLDFPGIALVGPEVGVERSATGRPVIMDDRCAVRLNSDRENWLLRFWMAPREADKLSAFEQALAVSFEGDPIDPTQLTGQNIRQLVDSEEALKKLRRAFTKAAVNTNASSLVMLSTPDDVGLTVEELLIGRNHAMLSRASAWLHTGDATLRKYASQRMANHFGDYLLSSVGTLTLPHHGSADNFHPVLLSKLPNLRVAIALRGPHADSRKWAHPAAKVISAVCAASVLPWVVTEQGGSSIASKSWRVFG